MAKKSGPPRRGAAPKEPIGILELDRFSENSLRRWAEHSHDLDELHAALYFGVLPEQRRIHEHLITSLTSVEPIAVDATGWVRIVSYKYSLNPLSCAGSMTGVGGRFNAGVDLDHDTVAPWPALYLAQDYETAFREKFGISSQDRRDGLTAEDLALVPLSSHTAVVLSVHLSRVFDLTSPANLGAIAALLGRVKMPVRARQLKRKLDAGVGMIQSSNQLYNNAVVYNWRTTPIQFGLPSVSHQLAALIKSAGFEGILYKSSKAHQNCLATFPDCMTSTSFIELADPAPDGIKQHRLDESTSEELCGWDTLPSQLRKKINPTA